MNNLNIRVWNCFDPEAIEPEYREYNFCARVELDGTWREKYFDGLQDGLSWAYDMALELNAKQSSEKHDDIDPNELAENDNTNPFNQHPGDPMM